MGEQRSKRYKNFANGVPKVSGLSSNDQQEHNSTRRATRFVRCGQAHNQPRLKENQITLQPTREVGSVRGFVPEVQGATRAFGNLTHVIGAP